MASKTKQVSTMRKNRDLRLGKKRKALLAKNGTTPVRLTLDKPNANEKALKTKKSK